MRQWNNVTDHTLEVDRDKDKIRAQEQTSESGSCAPPHKMKSIQEKYSGKKKRCDRIRGWNRMTLGYSTVRLFSLQDKSDCLSKKGCG